MVVCQLPSKTELQEINQFHPLSVVEDSVLLNLVKYVEASRANVITSL
jgi:hypothetical protein